MKHPAYPKYKDGGLERQGHCTHFRKILNAKRNACL